MRIYLCFHNLLFLVTFDQILIPMNTQSHQGTISTQLDGKVAYLSFFHPASNSFPSKQLQQLYSAITAISSNTEISVVVLQSDGDGAFCAGASFDELLQIENTAQGHAFFSGFANVINAIRKSPQIFIGRIHGKTVGGGVGLAAACDYCLATSNASIKLSELAIGIGPFVIEPAVSKKIGRVAMAEMSLEATQWKTATWAKEKGLYARVFQSYAELQEETRKFAMQLSSYNAEALQEMKKIFWEGTHDWDALLSERAAISGRLVLSDFTTNALQQFKKNNEKKN